MHTNTTFPFLSYIWIIHISRQNIYAVLEVSFSLTGTWLFLHNIQYADSLPNLKITVSFPTQGGKATQWDESHNLSHYYSNIFHKAIHPSLALLGSQQVHWPVSWLSPSSIKRQIRCYSQPLPWLLVLLGVHKNTCFTHAVFLANVTIKFNNKTPHFKA